MKSLAPLLLLGLAGCISLEPDLPVAPSPVPASWPAGDPYLLRDEAPLPAITYRDIFRDPRLQSLVVQALANNRDLRIAAANIAAARAQVTITRANQIPQVEARAGGAVSGGGDQEQGVSPTIGFGVPAFELDLFGRLAALTKAQQQRLFSTEAAARTTRLALVADIARAWLAYAADSSLLAIAEQTVVSGEKSVTLTRARLEGGIAPATDLLRAQQVLETAREDAAEQRSALAQDLNVLQLLVGASIDPAMLPASIEQIRAT
ncbi:MAG TPA: TolC family protein, partial [Sphingomicrobium sp.]|nr:TolC family protein [Sphingomicrobium sp.]